MKKVLLAMCAPLAVAAPALAQEPGQWELVWQDDFERAELGPDWSIPVGSARIVDGWLELTGGAATAVPPGSFPTDVRLEFQAMAVADRAPCDISVSFAGNDWWGRGGYLLAFGGKSNTVNQLLGHGIHIVDEEPPFLIEHGKKYHCIATKEGRRLTYQVNGTTILSAEDPNPLGGPGFDRIGLVTWTGLLADWVKAYRRVPPSPDAPNPPPTLLGLPVAPDANGRLRVAKGVGLAGLDAAMSAYNEHNFLDAARLFQAVPDRLVKAAGLAYTYGNLNYPENTAEFQALADLFQALAAPDPEDERLAGCAWAAKEFRQLKIIRGSHDAALRLTESGPENNPFYHKARMYLARYLWWDGAEGGDQRLKNLARDIFAELREVAPDQPVIREYLGEAVPWGEDLIAQPDGVPEWAAYLREAYARQVRIIEWWFDHRQAPDGQLGGGWGDDVEILRSWSPIAAISTGSPKVVAGIEKMSEGIWRILTNGYAGGIGDVEHSAEPSADTMPAMLLLRYGDPLWVERNLATARTIRDVLTGRDAKGYVRFKSTELGANAVGTHPRQGGDTAYHGRVMKHLIWLAWQGNTGARDLFLNWAEGWAAAITAKIGTKPAGVPPGTLWYPSGDISPSPDIPWWDPDYNYYGWPGPFSITTDALLSAYRLSGDLKYLEPLLSVWTTATSGPLVGSGDEGEPGSDTWIRRRLQHRGGRDQLAYYRWLTGDGAYDEYQRRFDSGVTKYQLDGDLDAYLASFEGAAKGLRNNFAMRTSEVIMTDRAGMDGAKVTFAAYTGAPRLWGDAGTPLIAVTWVVPDTDFAAVVTHATEQRLRVWLYNFHQETTRMGMRVWRLQPGNYVVTQGEILHGERPFQHRYGWAPPWPVTVAHRGDVIWVDVPAGVAYAVDIRLREPRPTPATAPDLAIAPRDISIERADAKRSNVLVMVHNIGNDTAREFRVALEVRDDEAGWKQINSKGLARLDAPTDLDPKRVLVKLAGSNADLAKGWRVVVDSEAAVRELYEGNNIVQKG